MPTNKTRQCDSNYWTLFGSPDIGTVSSATVLWVQIQTRYRLRRQCHGQLQFCVPLVALKGDSYRLKDRDLGRVPAATGSEE